MPVFIRAVVVLAAVRTTETNRMGDELELAGTKRSATFGALTGHEIPQSVIAGLTTHPGLSASARAGRGAHRHSMTSFLITLRENQIITKTGRAQPQTTAKAMPTADQSL